MQLLSTLALTSHTIEKKDGVFYETKRNKKLSITVVRVNNTGDMCNARPCHNCLAMMKAVNIRKVYYSISSTNIICENVKDMISIQSSAVTKYIEELTAKVFLTHNQYYEQLLLKNFPKTVKAYNLDTFIKYNLSNVLPSYRVIIDKVKSKVSIINSDNVSIVTSVFYE